MPYLPGLIHKRSGETKFFISLKTWRKCNPLSVVLQVLSFKKYSINPFRSNNSRYCLNGIWLREALERISVCRTFWPLARLQNKGDYFNSTSILFCIYSYCTISAHNLYLQSHVYNKSIWIQRFTSRFLGIFLSKVLSTTNSNYM